MRGPLTMTHFPAFLAIDNLPCLVVGGGAVAARKVKQLRAAGAVVTVVAPGIGAALRRQAQADSGIDVRHRCYDTDDLATPHLVVAATDDARLNAVIAGEAKARRIPVNVVDQPALCTFIVPSTVDRSPVQIAISTGGASPVLARLLRARLESTIPAAFGRLASLVERWRGKVKTALASDDRRRFWDSVLQGHVAELVFSGRMAAAETRLGAMLADAAGRADRMGEVYLIGAGPGDPDLLTFRALRLMQQADVVLYDRLVSDRVLSLARRDAECIHVGKAQARHSVPQQQINQMLARLARQGKCVVRLKGGDPFIFGRGGEEAALLAAQGVPFQVVPGITAAAGCAAYAGIPLTHRDRAQSVIFVTGHLKDGTVTLNWPMLAQPGQTVVFYMGLNTVALICRALKAHGMPACTPAALVEKGTTEQQRLLIGDLDNLPEIVRAHDVSAPTLIIIGDVVSLHDRLQWFQPSAEVTGIGHG